MGLPQPEETATWSDADYFAYDAVNASAIKQFAKSPKAYGHYLRNPPAKTSSMTLGSAIHCLTFEPGAFEDRYAVWDGGSRRTKAYKEWGDQHEGKELLTADEHETALSVASAASNHQLLKQLIGHPGTQLERALVWFGFFGICKAKIDLLHYSEEYGLIILDLKSTSSELDEHSITHTIGKYGVHLQLHHYFEAACSYLRLPSNTTPAKLFALYARTSAPFEVSAFELGEQTKQEVSDYYQALADEFDFCMASGHWPGQPEQRLIEVPTYYSQRK